MRSIRDLPPLLLRADASEKIGTGHVMRCLALAGAWQSRGGTAVFVSSCANPTLRERISRSGSEFISLGPETAGSVSNEGMTSVLSSKTAFVVLDGYHFGPEDQRLIQASGHNVAVIDDTAHCGRYDAEMILNQNLGAQRLKYVCPPETLLLLGPSYSLLRPRICFRP